MVLKGNDYRGEARKYCEWACNGTQGTPEGTSSYLIVTEHRDLPPYPNSYSSCADLGHGMLYHLGVRCDFINRAEHKGWVSGVNLSRFAYAPQPLRMYFPPKEPLMSDRYGCGDILVIYNKTDGSDGHVLVVLEDRGIEILAANYGAPGGKIAVTRRSAVNGHPALGASPRFIRQWLDLDKVIEYADVGGELGDIASLPLVWRI